MPRNYFIPISQVFKANITPEDLFQFPEDNIFDRIGITDYRVRTIHNGIYFMADLAIDPENDGDPTIELLLPQFPDIKLIYDNLGRVEAWLQEDFKLRMSVGNFTIQLPKNILKPAWEDAGDDDYVEIEIKYDHIINSLPQEARDYPIILTIDRFGKLDIIYPFKMDDGSPIVPIISLNGPAMIGDSGIVIEAENISFNFDLDEPEISLGRASVKFPPDLIGSIDLPNITFENASISRHGFTGSVTASWPLFYKDSKFVYDYSGQVMDAKLFDLKGGIRNISLSFEKNRLTGSDITGGMILPFFDDPMDIELGISDKGNFQVIIQGTEPDKPIILNKEDLFNMKVQSIALINNFEKTSIEVSGAIQPLFYSSEGVTWPEASVEGLEVGYKKNDLNNFFVDIKGGWIDFKDQAILDLYGFKAELNKIGFGREDEKLWFGFTGSIKLVEVLPIGASMKEAKVLWDPRNTLETLDFRLKGIEIIHSIPQIMDFKGSAYFLTEDTIKGFGGDLELNLPTVGFSAEAGMLVGINEENPPYPFFYIYLGVELPSGIPLGQSGLALKGVKGLFGYNVFPKRAPEENWYYDWYKRPPKVGVEHSTKWYPMRAALAFGAGVTITTADGYVKGVKALLAFMLPGPVVVIEGRALFLAGLKPDAEPPLRMLAILDGNAKTIQLNVEAQAEIVEDVLDAYGGLEAFFNFNDITLWHIYLGQDQPEDRRIQGTILKFFNANAYLMLDNNKMKMGAYIGIDEEFNYEVVKIKFKATIGGTALLGWCPEQVEGSLGLQACIGLSVPGFSLNIGAGADVLTKGPTPFIVDTSVNVKVDLPWPLPDFEEEFKFHWDEPVAPKIESPLSEISIGNDHGSKEYILDNYKDLNDEARSQKAESSQVVSLDSRPLISFTHPINDRTESFFRDTSAVMLSYKVGKFKFKPNLKRIQIFKHEGNEWNNDNTDWELIYDTQGTGEKKLKGVWLADNEPSDTSTPGARRVRLWTKSPFAHTAHSPNQSFEVRRSPRYQTTERNNQTRLSDQDVEVRRWGTANNLTKIISRQELGLNFSGESPTTVMGNTDYIDGFLTAHPYFGTCIIDKPEPRCIDFKETKPGEKNDGLEINGIRINGSDLKIIEIQRRRYLPGLTMDKKISGKSKISEPQEFKKNVIDLWRHNNYEALHSFLDEMEKVSPLPVLSASSLSITLPTPAKEITFTFDGYCRTNKGEIELKRSRYLDEYAKDINSWKEGLDRLIQEFESLENKNYSLRKDSESGKENLVLNIMKYYQKKPKFPDDVCATKVEVGDLKINRYKDRTKITITALNGEPFQCIQIGTSCNLSNICYLDYDEVQREAEQNRLCETSQLSIFEDEIVLNPNSHYRIVVNLLVIPERLPLDLPQEVEPFIKPIYDLIARELATTEFTQEAFFQTGSPPDSLKPYVLWSSPNDGEKPVFRGYDLAVRFNRSYIKEMFCNEENHLYVGVYDTNGQLHEEIRQVQIIKSDQEPFLFLYERVAKDEFDQIFKNDDIFYISFNNPLYPEKMYEMKVFSSNITEDLEDSLLFNLNFITSKFESFDDMIAGSVFDELYPDQIITEPDRRTLEEYAIILEEYAQKRFILQELEYAQKQGVAKREEIEAAKRLMNETASNVDSMFEVISENISNLRFRPLPDNLKIYRLGNDNGTIGFFIRSPEPIDWQEIIYSEISVGRVSLKINGSENPENPFYNSDKTQAIIILAPESQESEFRFEFIYESEVDCPITIITHSGVKVNEDIEELILNLSP